MEYPAKALLFVIKFLCAVTIYVLYIATYIIGVIGIFLWNPRKFSGYYKSFSTGLLEGPFCVDEDKVLHSQSEEIIASGDVRVTRIYTYMVYQTPYDWFIDRKQTKFKTVYSIRKK